MPDETRLVAMTEERRQQLTSYLLPVLKNGPYNDERREVLAWLDDTWEAGITEAEAEALATLAACAGSTVKLTALDESARSKLRTLARSPEAKEGR